MTSVGSDTLARFRAYGSVHLDRIEPLNRLSPDARLDLAAVAAVFPFRVNDYVLDELIDWDRAPEDPLFQLTFPQGGMLEPAELRHMRDLIRREAPAETIRMEARRIQTRLNPHPGGQMQLNVPRLNGKPLPGLQHKYRETVLVFPSAGQTCHAYCSYCFRWAQFVGLEDLRFACSQVASLVSYLHVHPEVTDVLFTGGDPLIMRSSVLRRFVEPLLEIDSLQSIRIGTKALAYWPQRFVADRDADDLLRLFEEVRARGKHVALMSHTSHPRELETALAQRAIRRILDSGAAIRCQAPLIRHVNDDCDLWAEMWRLQVRLGAVPYYMFVERDTGARDYFELPLALALQIYQGAFRQVSGLARTARGPSMSATPGKILIDGVAQIEGQEVFVLRFLQARDPRWIDRVFFARYDPDATWIDQLEPAFGERDFFFDRKVRCLDAQSSRLEEWRQATGAGRHKSSTLTSPVSPRRSSVLRPSRRS